MHSLPEISYFKNTPAHPSRCRLNGAPPPNCLSAKLEYNCFKRSDYFVKQRLLLVKIMFHQHELQMFGL